MIDSQRNFLRLWDLWAVFCRSESTESQIGQWDNDGDHVFVQFVHEVI